MYQFAKNLYQYRELLLVLTWKNVIVRYKQSHLGLMWVVLKPLAWVVIFMLVRSFVGIDSGDIPYPLLTYCAMVPWIFFQESASEGVGSVVNHANLIRKIYFPRELFPIAAVLTKLVDLGIGLVILLMMMVWFKVFPGTNIVWLPFLLLLVMLSSLTIGFVGAALNVYSRDIGQLVPLVLTLMMYASPVIYPLDLVKRKLIEQQAAGDWSHFLYTLYALNPMTGVVDSFQRVMLMNLPPDWSTLLPGQLVVVVGLPLSYLIFKQAEAFFADMI